MAKKKMNVLVLNSDSFRRDNLTCYGGTHVHTPRLDELASNSLIFDEVITGSFPTLPNRTDIFLGTWTFPNKPWSPLDRNVPCLAQMLSKAGVATALEIDTPHMCSIGGYFERGFDSWRWERGLSSDALPSKGLSDKMIVEGDDDKTLFSWQVKRHLASQIIHKRLRDEDWSCARLARNAVENLKFLRDTEQFFLWVDMFQPHEPFDPPRHYFDMYYPEYKDIIYIQPIYGKASAYSKKELLAIRAAYLGLTTMVDYWLGYILDHLVLYGLDETTTIIFVSDHGLAYGDHGYTGKCQEPLFENIVRLPLLISTPEMRVQGKSRRASQLVQPVDLTPTILDLLGVKPFQEWAPEGVSLMPIIQGKPMKTRDTCFTGSHHYEPDPAIPAGHLRISTERWALVFPPYYDEVGRPMPMLYDVKKDPMETRNVIKQHMDVAMDLYQRYVAFYKRHNKTGEDVPVPDPQKLMKDGIRVP